MDYSTGNDEDFANITQEIFTNSSNFLTNPFAIAEIGIAILALIENLIVLIVLCCNKNLRGRIYYFITSLCFADFLVGAVAIPSALLVRKLILKYLILQTQLNL